MSKESTRREFLGRNAAAVAALGPAAASAAQNKPSKAKHPRTATTRVLGANDRINVAFIGCGMQFHGLLERGFYKRKEAKNDFEYAALCDIYEPRAKYGQEKTKAEKTYSDFHDVLARPDIDGVVIAVPDHWHYAIAKEALESGKDVYLEKPMTYTIAEAEKLSDLVGETNRILQVGGSGPSTRLYWKINEYIKSGKMGKVLWGLISYNRNTRDGMWDYPIPGVGEESFPSWPVEPGKNLDWAMWLGPAKKRPFSADRYFRWRKYWDYSGGNATDLLYHRLGMMSTMIGFDFPTRASAAGGIYVQKDREVPDTYMTMVEYPGDYCVNMVSCIGNSQSVPMTVYANWGTLHVLEGQAAMGAMGDVRQAAPQSGGRRREQAAVVRAERAFEKEFKDANGGATEVTIEGEPSTDLVDDWLDCMRSRGTPVYNVLRGYQVMVAIKLGVESYRAGRIMAYDASRRRVLPAPPAHKEYLPAEA